MIGLRVLLLFLGLVVAAPAWAQVTRKQSAVADGVNPTATFGATPIAGNLLVSIASSRSGTACASHTISGTGWTKHICRDTELGNATYRRSLSIWTKVAGASEPTSVQVSGDTVRLVTQELEDSAARDWTFVAQASSDNGAVSNAATAATGTTVSVDAGDLVVIGIVAVKNSASTAITSVSWTNGLGDNLTSDGGGFGRHISTAFDEQINTGEKSSVGTLNGANSNDGVGGGILVFELGATPPSPQFFRRRVS